MIMKPENESTQSSIVVRGLCCATEENLIRKKLSSLEGIGSLSLNVVTHRLLALFHPVSINLYLSRHV